MQLVDSHCHLDRVDLSLFENNIDNVLQAARERDICHFLNISVDLNNFEQVLAIANAYSDVHCSVGIHPLDESETVITAQQLISRASHEKVVAIGETGLDAFYAPQSLARQYNNFVEHMEAALETQLPVIIHTREAKQQTLDLIGSQEYKDVNGVLHCFTEDWDMAKKAIDLGYYISISGIVTFANANNVRDVVKQLPLDRLLVETDAPYLTPVPYRGKPNYPIYVREVAEYIAKFRNIELDLLAQHTTENFFKLFNKIKTAS
jgi:TatD DNase family protein